MLLMQVGGITESANLDEVNLAYVLQDGQKIYIPSKEDKKKMESKVYITSESGENVIVQDVNEEKKGGKKKVNINTATQEELELQVKLLNIESKMETLIK